MDINKLRNYIKEYKNNFLDNFKEERYKWKAVKCFQENWDMNAENFIAMYNNATKFERNLLTQNAPKLPKKMVNHFIYEGWENEVKEAFSVLYDETEDVNYRIDKFINIMNEINTKRNNKNQRSDISAHEDLNIASVYLWLKYPDKYYMYKPNVCKNISKALNCDYKILHKRNRNANKINFEKTQEMYRQIQNEILKDNELQYILKTNLNYQEEYYDEKYHILAQDIGYFINKIEEKNKIRKKVWIFAAGEGAKLWEEFYNDGIMALGWDDVGDLRTYKSQKELKEKIQKLNQKSDSDFRNRVKALWDICNTVSENDIIYVKKGNRKVIGCGIVSSNYQYDETRKGYEHYRKIDWNSTNEYENIREEDFATKALTEITDDIELCKKLENLYRNGEDNMDKQPLNQILYGPPGTGKTYNTKRYIEKIIKDNKENSNEKFNVLNTTWVNATAYYMYKSDKISFKANDIKALLKDYIPTKKNQTPIKKLYEILQKHTSPDSLYVSLRKDLREKPYLFDKDADKNWYLTEEGKRFVEELLEGDEYGINDSNNLKHFVEFITFHQSYSYEEFVEGIKPDITSKDLKYEYNKGIFKEMCIRANSDPDNNYVLVIDEINRGNISKIFGELITLIETDKRIKANGENDFIDNELIITSDSKQSETALTVRLPYTKQEFGIPDNLYIIGTMNTADKSLTLLDVALRRRFEFVPKYPQYDKTEDGQTIYYSDFLKKLNEKIFEKKKSADYLIGHSYFMCKDGEPQLRDILNKKVIPLLMEYFNNKVGEVTDILKFANPNIEYNSQYSFKKGEYYYLQVTKV